jgi:hypothetical protein
MDAAMAPLSFLSEKENPRLQVLRLSLLRQVFRGLLGPGRETLIVRLPVASTNVQSTAGGIIALTQPVNLISVAGYGDWSYVFATYRIRKFTFEFVPYFAGSSTNTGVIAAGIDDGAGSGAMGSFDATLQLSGAVVQSLYKRFQVEWSAGSDGYDDFYECSSPSVAYAYMKTYTQVNSGVGVTTNYGVIVGHAEVEFSGFN